MARRNRYTNRFRNYFEDESVTASLGDFTTGEMDEIESFEFSLALSNEIVEIVTHFTPVDEVPAELWSVSDYLGDKIRSLKCKVE